MALMTSAAVCEPDPNFGPRWSVPYALEPDATDKACPKFDAQISDTFEMPERTVVMNDCATTNAIPSSSSIRSQPSSIRASWYSRLAFAPTLRNCFDTVRSSRSIA